MTHRTAAALVAALLISLPVCGCYESVGVTWYEAGEYKGPRDPLLNKLKTDELQRQLADRFRDVQTDR